MQKNNQGQYNPHWYCHRCGADFRNWMQLPGEVRRAALRRRPDDGIVTLIQDRCPWCASTVSRP